MCILQQEGLFWGVHSLLDPLHCPAHSALDRPRWQTSVLHGSRSREVSPCLSPNSCGLMTTYFREPGHMKPVLSCCSPSGFWCRSPSSRPTGLFLWFTPSTRSSSCVTMRRCSWWTRLPLMCLWLRWTTREHSPWVWQERNRTNLLETAF